jgi:hypothetical protein
MFHVSMCCKLLAIQVLLQGYEQMEIHGPHIDKQTCDWLGHYSWEVRDHPLNSPDQQFPYLWNP